MAATGGDATSQELNFVFRSLAEQGKEAKKWKEHTEIVLFYILEQLTELLEKHSENNIVFQPYGSAAEDLKCIQPDDVGDVDIVIFPKSDNLMIHDGLIEYLLENPMHVRIKGADHPVLQSCLVEDTEYVATSALKNFHQAIYGSSAPYIADTITRAYQQISTQKELSSLLQSTYISCLKNNATGPAITTNFARSLKDPPLVLPHRIHTDEWEWLVHVFCKATGTVYTREHAEVIDDITRFMNEVGVFLDNKGLISTSEMLPVFQEFYWSDRAKNLKARFRNIESRPQDKTQRGTDNFMDKTKCNENQKFVALEPYDEHQSEKKNLNFSQGTLSLNERSCVKTQNTAEEQRYDETENPDQLQKKTLSKQVFERECVDDRNKTEMNEDQQSLRREGEVSCHGLQRNRYRDCNEKDEKRELEKRMQNHFYDHVFGTLTETEGGCFKKNTVKDIVKSRLHQQNGGFDFVPAFKSPGWPKVAREWIKRERNWPLPDIVDRVLQEGFHLVVKAPKNGGKPECDFRISFAHAEYLLSQEMNDIQRECYRCLKKYHRAYLSTEPKSLVTFHLKNLLLQTIEETGAEMWTESKRAECMMVLLGNLLEALRKKDLRHFFVRSYNLFSVDYIENPKILESLTGVTELIMENPMRFAKALIKKNVSEDRKGEKPEECIPACKPILSTTTVTGHTNEDIEETPNNCSISESSEATFQETSSFTSYRYHDLKDIFLTVSKELTDIAFNDADCRLEALDPLQRSLVKDLKEIERHHIIQAAEFPKMFDICWDAAYYKVLINPEPNMRRRMLDGIKGVLELCKYVFKQDDFEPGNEDAIIKRMHDSTSEDCFDLNHILPAGSGPQLVRRIFYGLGSRQAQAQNIHLDDIPLD